MDTVSNAPAPEVLEFAPDGSLRVNNRSAKWDNAKFVLIFLVVLGHIADIYAGISDASGIMRFIIYTFHMPAFIFISGLFGKKNIRERRYNKLFSYLVLYLLIKALDFIAKWIVNGTKPAFHLFADGSVPWYAFFLFAAGLIVIAVDRFDRRYVFVFSVLLALIAGYDNDLGDFLCVSRIIVFFPFYFAGYCLDPGKVKVFLNRKPVRIVSVIIIAALIAVSVFFYEDIKDVKFLFTGRNPYGIYKPGYVFAFLVRLACYLVSALVLCAFLSLIPEGRKYGFIARAGARSVQIYALHFFFKILYFGLINDRFGIEGYFESKLIIYELIVSVVLTAICAPPFWGKIINKITTVPLKKE